MCSACQQGDTGFMCWIKLILVSTCSCKLLDYRLSMIAFSVPLGRITLVVNALSGR
jgi:hypothetical protein